MLLSVNDEQSKPDPQSSTSIHIQNDHLLHLPDLSPSFSIREYVFSARSKDIKKSWPFSRENLQLCLKHGVKDVLPPFQSLDALRTQVCKTCTVEINPPQGTINDDNPSSIDVSITDSLHQLPNKLKEKKKKKKKKTKKKKKIETKLPYTASCTTTNNLFRSTTTSVSQSEIEESVPTVSKLPPQIDRHKPRQGLSRGSSKSRCKLIVKFSSHTDRRPTEDIASNSSTQSEAMASKICPVCKTFSSPSNTTLNAHIDQCLSAESSTPKWTVDSKLSSSRHRIKARKTRMMVDIYTTALPCTLEDLDRRNGSNWASGALNFPTPSPSPEDPESEKSETQAQQIEHQISRDDEDNTCDVDVGAVYIDSNGIKLRILSKPDDTCHVSKVIEHLRPRKPLKGSKFLSARKKKRRANKLTQYLKLAQTKKLLSSKSLSSSQVCGGRGKRQVGEGSDERVKKRVNVSGGDSETLRQWARSKRSGVVKKLPNSKDHLSGNRSEENIFYEAQVSHVVANKWSPLINNRFLTPMKRMLTKERTPRFLKSASISSTPPLDNFNTRLHGSKDTRVSSVRKEVTDAANKCLDVQKLNVRTQRTDEQIVPWDSEADDIDHNFGTQGRKEVPVRYHSHRDYQYSIDTMNVSRMSNKVAFDPEMNKMDPLCDVPASGPSFGDGQEMFYGVQLGNDMSLNSDTALGISFPDVDPIPIPGPPGSFLPSPRDMSSEDFQGNSSLTTSRVQSSQDQREFNDGDSSDSPVSATSTVSSGYDLEAPPPSASQDKFRSCFSGNSVGSSIDMATGLGFDREKFKVKNNIPVGFKTESSEPCCCQRKERVCHDNMKSQELQVLKRRDMDEYAFVSGRPQNQMDSISPSTSNSILRLMGKNLMVVNRDQDESMAPQINHHPQQTQHFYNTMNHHQQQQQEVVYPMTRPVEVEPRLAVPMYGFHSDGLTPPVVHQTGQYPRRSGLYKCQSSLL